MVGFGDLHKLVSRRNAFSAFSNAQNGGEIEGGVESEGSKCQFSHTERDLDLQNIFKQVSISNRKAPKKKTIVLKNENEKKMKKLEKIGWILKYHNSLFQKKKKK